MGKVRLTARGERVVGWALALGLIGWMILGSGLVGSL